ncbi:MAG: UDP-N-acetylglucosamine 2-epimerase (non-hydrolyzing) [Bdellovibrionales bacterium]|nr:UDP-N-acetylglucosamine 2-epimerase (non-hydrolyzing) [Bdellovibrionales bacterium]
MSYVAVIAGARPNFMKVDPILRAFKSIGIPHTLIHTGQHYDVNMSDVFFSDLGIPHPDVHLEVGSGSHAEQTAKVMMAYEQLCLENFPKWTLVVGDVNSTIACALVSAKLGIKVCHVEAGLRSGDWSMPEEVNRVLTDRLSDLLFTHSPEAHDNLASEGIDLDRVHYVGNVMIDTLLRLLPKAKESGVLDRFSLTPGGYAVGTFHRPSNVDTKGALTNLVDILAAVSEKTSIVLPVHPRTKARLEMHSLLARLTGNSNIILCEPLGYLDFVGLYSQSRLVLTDSAGLQEETTALGIPCLTMRENTERPITVTEGTNKVVGCNPENVISAAFTALKAVPESKAAPKFWDGKAAIRIAEIMARDWNLQKVGNS